jgi:hypothetical protein
LLFPTIPLLSILKLVWQSLYIANSSAHTVCDWFYYAYAFLFYHIRN